MSILKSKTDKEDLLEDIANDEILSTFKENLRVATKKAQGRASILELRMAGIMTRIEKGDFSRTPVDTIDPDEIEKSVEFVETKDTLERKLFALQKAYGRSWTLEAGYRKAMLEYLKYAKPILTDLENTKDDLLLKIQAMKQAHAIELNVLTKEFEGYEKENMKLLNVAGLQGMHMYSVRHEAMFGRRVRADHTVDYGINEAEREPGGYPVVKLNVETRPEMFYHAGSPILFGLGK